MNGVSTEYLEMREDEIARFIIAAEHVDKLRQLAAKLRQRGWISEAYHGDMQDSLAFIEAALLTGKRNTATLRNGGTR